MADPLSFFVAPRQQKPLPVAPVDPKQLAEWAAETEIEPGSGGARRGGRYHVTAGVSANQKTALAAYDTLRAAGYPAVIRPVRTESGTEYHVRLLGFPSSKDAGATVAKLKALGLTEAAVSR